ncbi:serine-aspartate repeat-containing protein I [Triticum urartu]|uniref:serine-aspartate repeat-containing protein I-like n=1 Tax=Triticum dicoccoides TaxID=85692 RepID=UPI00162EC01C|nr:serine-aspartate repeat-containing protein I-like [Triticum dicoccoides]XP_048546688.1 serine-aspartate repeat-containing protein I [Triticum urartu]
MSISGNGHLPAAASTGPPDHSSASSDSEVEVEVEGDADYLPISGAASDSDSDADPDPDLASRHRLDAVDNGVSELDLASDDEESDEEEGAGATEAAAALDDERRRRAQLPAGAAARIVDAMRGVAFPGAPPPWAGAVPDEQWLERLRSLRGGRD